MKQIVALTVACVLLALSACTTNIVVNNKSSDMVTVTLDGAQSMSIGPDTRATWPNVPSSFLDPSPTFKAVGDYIDEQSQKLSLTPGKDASIDVTNTRTYLKIVNGSSVKSIYYIYISPSSSNNWGTNWMPTTVATGASVYYRIAPGMYDLKVVFSDNYTTYSFSNTVNNLTTLVKTPNWTYTNFAPVYDPRPATVAPPKDLL